MAPLVKATLLTSPVRSSQRGAMRKPEGSAITLAGSSRAVMNTYTTYRRPAAVFRTPWAMWSQPLSVLMGTAPAPFLLSVIV